jgi:hypothetical protein
VNVQDANLLKIKVTYDALAVVRMQSPIYQRGSLDE